MGLFTAFAPIVCFAQARVVLNNDAWLRIDNSAWVVVEDPANTGIQTLGTGGNIRSEGEFNRIRWQIRNSTGVYTVPFTTANGVKMPLTYEVTAAGSNEPTASIGFSTFNYGTIGPTNWNNDLYRPSDVTHMYNYWTGAPVNNSDNVVDRFWEIDPGMAGHAYGTKPAIRLGFTYDPGAATGDLRVLNAITAVDPVGAQRFNWPTGQWGDMWPQGTFAMGAVNTVTNANISAADFFRSWTLSNILQPLPVELIRFEATCDKGAVQLAWSTGSELNAGHFVIERSGDGIAYHAIGQVLAAGNTHSLTNYAFADDRPMEVGYYRLRQVDLDGTDKLGPVQAAGCGSAGDTYIVNAWDDGADLYVVVNAADDQAHFVRLVDAAGRMVWTNANVFLSEGVNTVRVPKRDLATGVYTIRFDGPKDPMARRIALF